MHPRVEQAGAVADTMVDHRRHLHRNPEVGLDLPDTHAWVADRLRDLGLQPEVHEAAGVTVHVPGHTPSGTTRILRADMDGLPVTEATGLAFSSDRDGAMHACGHDLHTAMLLGAATVLADRPPRDDTVLVFQPGEETDRGAVPTLAAHANLQVDDATAFALHVHAQQPPHSLNLRAGVFMAAGDWFRIDLAGPGTHASQPHLAGNPVEAAADMVTAIRTLVADLAATEHLVVTTTESRIGSTVNVISATGRLRGTIRTLSDEVRAQVHAGLDALARRIAADDGLQVDTTITHGYPAVVNDAAQVAGIEAGVTDAGLGDLVTPMAEPSMVIEDFSYFLQRWPGAMVYLGAHVPPSTAFNHANDADYDEAVLPTGAALHLLAADGLLAPNPER